MLFVLPFSMFYERNSEFLVAAPKPRAVRPWPDPPASPVSVPEDLRCTWAPRFAVAPAAHHPLAQRALRPSGGPPVAALLTGALGLDFPASAAEQTLTSISNRDKMGNSHPLYPVRRGGRLIVTPRLEFPPTATKQRPRHFSNRYKPRFLRAPSRMAILLPHLGTSTSAEIRIHTRLFLLQSPVPMLSLAASVARGRRAAGGSTSESWVSLRCGIKFKSLLCYGDSHFQPVTMVASAVHGPNGEN